MEVLFKDPGLGLIETDRAAETGLPVQVIKSARRKLVVLRAATDERALRNWKSLNYKKLKGDKSGRRTIRLNKQYRIVFLLDSETDPQTVTVLEIGDTH